MFLNCFAINRLDHYYTEFEKRERIQRIIIHPPSSTGFVIENHGIPVVITDVLVRKHKITGRSIYINHPDSINKIEKGLKAALGVASRGQTSYKRRLSESGEILVLRLPKEFRESYHIEKGTHARITPIGMKKAIVEFE